MVAPGIGASCGSTMRTETSAALASVAKNWKQKSEGSKDLVILVFGAPAGAIANESFGEVRAREKVQMDVAAENRSHSVAFRRFFVYATDRLRHGIDDGIPELVSSCMFTRHQPTFRTANFDFDVAELRQALLHTGACGEDPAHRPTSPLRVDDRPCQVHEAAALGIYRRIVRGEFYDGGSHRLIRRQGFRVQLRVSAAEIDPIQALGQRTIRNWAEVDEFCAQRA